MPRAKKTATKTEKKVVAKKTTKKVSKPEINLEALKKELRKEIQEQIEEAILNIEIDVPEPVAQAPSKNTEASLNRSTLTLEGKKRYTFVSDLDGLVISELDKSLLTLSNTGSIGIGTKAPRSSGIGSMHVRANYTSEAPIPTTGYGSTRGLIVEGDGDDEGIAAVEVGVGCVSPGACCCIDGSGSVGGIVGDGEGGVVGEAFCVGGIKITGDAVVFLCVDGGVAGDGAGIVDRFEFYGNHCLFRRTGFPVPT